jgi:hypothetical protein
VPSVFISYKHDVQPDVRLAGAVLGRLREAGHDVFIDSQIKVGDDWSTVIEEKVRSAEYLIVFLSPAAAASEMVIEEIRIARRIRAQQGRPKILPVRVAHEEPLPYELGAYLDQLQYALWRTNADDLSILDQLAAAIEGRDLPAHAVDLRREPIDERNATPLPAFDVRWLDSGTGAMRVANPFYIERDLDRKAKEAVTRMGETILIRGSRQSGKSSALARICQHARENAQKTLFVDFQGVDKSKLQDLNSLLRYLADLISLKLKTPEGPDGYWKSALGPADQFSGFFETEVLQHMKAPFVFALDEVDRIFGYPGYASEFFGLLRSWHNKRAFDETWSNLNLVLAYSTESSLLIQDQNQSPFNVGEPLESSDFTSDQVIELNQRHGSPLSRAEIDLLMSVVSGHPYLVRKALFELVANRRTFDVLRSSAADDDGPFSDHLQRSLVWLAGHEGLKAAFKSLLQTGVCDTDTNFHGLRAAGLVRGHSRQSAQPRCGLYRLYFTERL